MAIPEQEWIPISALNHFEFCPRRCYYIHIEQLFVENEFTIFGHHHHRKVHTEHSETFVGGEAHYSLYLFSRKYGLYGQADKVELATDAVVPIEYKSGARKRWLNDRLQLCAQALCLEEMLDRPVEFGFLFYQKSRRRERIVFEDSLRRQTTEQIGAVRSLFQTKQRPSTQPKPRCEGCSFASICLPLETEILLQKQISSLR